MMNIAECKNLIPSYYILNRRNLRTAIYYFALTNVELSQWLIVDQ